MDAYILATNSFRHLLHSSKSSRTRQEKVLEARQNKDTLARLLWKICNVQINFSSLMKWKEQLWLPHPWQ